jgi:hypothetical protein
MSWIKFIIKSMRVLDMVGTGGVLQQRVMGKQQTEEGEE